MRRYSPHPKEAYALEKPSFSLASETSDAQWNLIWLAIPEVDLLLNPISDISGFFKVFPSALLGTLRVVADYTQSEDGRYVKDFMGDSPILFVHDFIGNFDLSSVNRGRHFNWQSIHDNMLTRAFQVDGMVDAYKVAQSSNKIVLVDFSPERRCKILLDRIESDSRAHIDEQQSVIGQVLLQSDDKPHNKATLEEFAHEVGASGSLVLVNLVSEPLAHPLFAGAVTGLCRGKEDGTVSEATISDEKDEELKKYFNQIGVGGLLNYPKNLQGFIEKYPNGIDRKSLVSAHPSQIRDRKTQEYKIADYLIASFRQLVKYGQKTPFEQSLAACKYWKGLLAVPIENLIVKYYAVARELRAERIPYNPSIELEIARDVVAEFAETAKTVEAKLAASRTRREAKKKDEDTHSSSATLIITDKFEHQEEQIITRHDAEFAAIKCNDINASINRIEAMLDSLFTEQSNSLDSINTFHQRSTAKVEAFAVEFAELRKLLLSTLQPPIPLSSIVHQNSVDLEFEDKEFDSMEDFWGWLVTHDTISFSELRIRLLPLDLLPSAVINDINERALDLTGEPALLEEGDNVIVQREVLLQVIAD